MNNQNYAKVFCGILRNGDLFERLFSIYFQEKLVKGLCYLNEEKKIWFWMKLRKSIWKKFFWEQKSGANHE